MEWRSVHVYFYDENKTDLVLDAVRPLFEKLSPHVAAAFYVPHWLRGPHLRLNFLTEPQVFAEVVRPSVDEVIGQFLARQPSTATPDTRKMLAEHERLAELERESAPLQPLLPDNSIHEAAYDQRLDVLGSMEAAELLADFYVATTPLTFDMLEYVRRGGQLLGLSFDLMVTTAHALSGIGFERGFVSFRSHAEAFLCWWSEGRGLRPAWERHYKKHAADLTADRGGGRDRGRYGRFRAVGPALGGCSDTVLETRSRTD